MHKIFLFSISVLQCLFSLIYIATPEILRQMHLEDKIKGKIQRILELIENEESAIWLFAKKTPSWSVFVYTRDL